MMQSQLEVSQSVLKPNFAYQQELTMPDADVGLLPDDLDIDEVESTASSFPIIKFGLTSIASLVATFGIGFLMTGKATDRETVPAQPNSVVPNIPSNAKQQAPQKVSPPTPSPKPEIVSNSVEFSTSQETQKLVQDSLAEYYALLDQSMDTQASTIRTTPN
jgi:hypothetical protein